MNLNGDELLVGTHNDGSVSLQHHLSEQHSLPPHLSSPLTTSKSIDISKFEGKKEKKKTTKKEKELQTEQKKETKLLHKT